MVAINNNYKVSKNEQTTNEEENKQIQLQIKIHNEHLKNITKIDKQIKNWTALLRRDTKRKTTAFWLTKK